MQLEYARGVLAFYRTCASHMITSRIHAAMPCLRWDPSAGTLAAQPTDGHPEGCGRARPLHLEQTVAAVGVAQTRITTDSFYQPRMEQLKADIIGKLRERLHEFGIR